MALRHERSAIEPPPSSPRSGSRTTRTSRVGPRTRSARGRCYARRTDEARDAARVALAGNGWDTVGAARGALEMARIAGMEVEGRGWGCRRRRGTRSRRAIRRRRRAGAPPSSARCGPGRGGPRAAEAVTGGGGGGAMTGEAEATARATRAAQSADAVALGAAADAARGRAGIGTVRAEAAAALEDVEGLRGRSRASSRVPTWSREGRRMSGRRRPLRRRRNDERNAREINKYPTTRDPFGYRTAPARALTSSLVGGSSACPGAGAAFPRASPRRPRTEPGRCRGSDCSSPRGLWRRLLHPARPRRCPGRRRAS